MHPNTRDFRRVRNSTHHKKTDCPDNEIRVQGFRSQGMYAQYAADILTGQGGRKQHDSVVITGMGAAIFKAVSTAEIAKRHVPGLHQVTEIGSIMVVDEYKSRKKPASPTDDQQQEDNSRPTQQAQHQPQQQQQQQQQGERARLEVERKVATIRIILSLHPLDPSHPGYQQPLSEAEFLRAQQLRKEGGEKEERKGEDAEEEEDGD